MAAASVAFAADIKGSAHVISFFLVWQVQVETLNVQPAVLLQVEDFAVFPVDFPVTVRPDACFVELE